MDSIRNHSWVKSIKVKNGQKGQKRVFLVVKGSREGLKSMKKRVRNSFGIEVDFVKKREKRLKKYIFHDQKGVNRKKW